MRSELCVFTAAAVILVGATTMANAERAQTPVVLTSQQMDAISAGLSGTDLGSSRVHALSGTDLGSGR